MARRTPVQARSIESMNRMLEAGEQLFYEGGSPALTLEAVIERAETSTGSFYARFGDMHGFLDAMHERVLAMLAIEVEAVVVRAVAATDLDTALRTYCIGIYDFLGRHRAQTYFFAVGNTQDAHWRAVGSQFLLRNHEAFAHLVAPHLPASSKAVVKRRIDTAGRMIIAAAFQQIMFDHREISRISLSPKMVATDLAEMVTLYLRSTPTK